VLAISVEGLKASFSVVIRSPFCGFNRFGS